MLNRRTERGFTLIEIMVVMVIIGLLVALVAPNIMGRGDQARVTTAKAQMRQISSALDMYRLDNSHYPSTQQGLEALVERPSGNPEPNNWNPEGYMNSVPRIHGAMSMNTSAQVPKAPMTCILWARMAVKVARVSTPISVSGISRINRPRGARLPSGALP